MNCEKLLYPISWYTIGWKIKHHIDPGLQQYHGFGFEYHLVADIKYSKKKTQPNVCKKNARTNPAHAAVTAKKRALYTAAGVVMGQSPGQPIILGPGKWMFIQKNYNVFNMPWTYYRTSLVSVKPPVSQVLITSPNT